MFGELNPSVLLLGFVALAAIVLLVLRSQFSEAATLDAWSIIRANSAKVNLFFDDSMPLNTAKPRSLRLEIESPGGDKVGVSNEGYWGISVKQG